MFSKEEFTVDLSVGLNGVCDFLISCFPELLEIEAPVVVIVAAKKADLTTDMGQCVAEVVVTQRLNKAKGQPISAIYGSVSNGTQWHFLKLEGQTVTIDLNDYPLVPVEQILGFFLWMIQPDQLKLMVPLHSTSALVDSAMPPTQHHEILHHVPYFPSTLLHKIDPVFAESIRETDLEVLRLK